MRRVLNPKGKLMHVGILTFDESPVGGGYKGIILPTPTARADAIRKTTRHLDGTDIDAGNMPPGQRAIFRRGQGALRKVAAR